MENKEIAKRLAEPISNKLKLLMILFIISVPVSVFMWIWEGYIVALKMLSTGVAAIIMIYYFNKFVIVCYVVLVENNNKKPEPVKKSRLQKRIIEYQKKIELEEKLEKGVRV